MIRSTFAALLCIAPLLASLPAVSQGGPVAPASSGASSISIDVVVTPKKGEPVSGLKQQDFKVLDDKVAVPITGFRAVQGPQAPVEVVLVIDAVNVPYMSVAYTRGQIEKFLRSNDGQLPFPTSIALFMDSGVQIQGGVTRDGNAEADLLNHASVSLRDLTRSAGFWGAAERFQHSMDGLRELADHEAARPGRKLIVWISPGWPLLSGPRMELDNKEESRIFANIVGLSGELRKSNITLYNVNPIGAAENPGRAFYYQDFLKGVSKLNQVQPADLSIQVLATQSGGLVLTSSNDLVGELQKCFADGMAYYELTFPPAPSESGTAYHSLEVQVASPGLTARTRQGYYAQQ